MREIVSVCCCDCSARKRHGSRLRMRAHVAAASILCLLLVSLEAPRALATVQSEILDDIWPMDNPITFEDEGLPNLGNQIDPGKGMTAADQGDPRTTYGNLPLTYDPPYFESRLDVIVGRTGSASLVIDAQSQLRYQDLIIGETFGSEGNVRIQGVSSLYNNNYLMLPSAIAPPSANSPGNPFGIVWGESIRQANGMADGFDLYVGQGGTGVMEILAGGRAEIQDAVAVGDEGGSEGLLVVDGTGSLLRSGGFLASAMAGNDIHQFVVGRLGTGTVRILNGGRIMSYGPTSSTSGSSEVTGAAIGGAPHENTQAPDAGGTGLVEMDGFGSTWTVGGDLQVGGFHANHILTVSMGDEEGDNVMYPSNVGAGTLLVKNGALVNIVSPVDPATGTTNAPSELSMLVGRRGTVDLQGGRIVMQSGFDPGSNPPDPIIDNVRIVNDGLIMGTGTIETGSFNNRYLGQVRVSAGEVLNISANTPFVGSTSTPIRPNPLANWGVIDVSGTEDQRAEIQFDHLPAASLTPPDAGPGMPATAVNIGHAFRNLRLTTPAPMPYPAPVHGGLITAQHATLRFQSGLENDGLLFFADGVNYVTGNVFNTTNGVILLNRAQFDQVGTGTTRAIFENDVLNGGLIESRFGTQLEILGRHSFTSSGRLKLGITGPESSNIFVAGDVALAGVLDFQLTQDLFATLNAGDSFEIISFDGIAYGVDDTDPLHPLPDFDNPLAAFDAGLSISQDSLDQFLVTGLQPITSRMGQSILVSFLNPLLAVGADFNFDGIVDDFDLAIWRQNVGNPGGLGDANNDGIVNARDFFVWLDQQGGMGMAPGSGAGSGQAVGAVPEPSSIALLLSGGMLALAAARRRRLLSR